jgi:cytochrome c-type biogenesis protein CcmH
VSATFLLLALLTGVALLVAAYVLWPLVRGGAPSPDAPGQADVAAVSRAVLRERRRELETALAHLPADSPERQAALAEFATQAEAELSGLAPAVTPQARTGRRAALAMSLGAVLLAPAFALYLLAGAPQAASPAFREARAPATLDEMVVTLQRRLADDPSQTEGWRLLGRAELARGRPEAARQAFERVLEQVPGEAQARADLADAIAQAQGAVLEGQPIALIREALAIDPKHPKALALAGAHAVTQRDFPTAIGHWERLAEVLPADSDQARQVAGLLADLRAGRLPQAGPRPESGSATAPPAPVASAAPPDRSTARLSGRVELERRLAQRVQADDTVFVVARTIDDSGRPSGPPVAVLRARGADLPLDFALDDRQAMGPASSLSAVPTGTRVVVIARVSRSGEAAARPGDLQGATAPIPVGASGLQVLVDTVLE